MIRNNISVSNSKGAFNFKRMETRNGHGQKWQRLARAYEQEAVSLQQEGMDSSNLVWSEPCPRSSESMLCSRNVSSINTAHHALWLLPRSLMSAPVIVNRAYKYIIHVWGHWWCRISRIIVITEEVQINQYKGERKKKRGVGEGIHCRPVSLSASTTLTTLNCLHN